MRLDRSKILAAGVVAAAALALTACGDDAPPIGGQPGHKAGGPTQEQVLASAPVAKSLPDSPTIDAIKKAGALRFGGGAARPLFSQFDPVTHTYRGFDAGLAYSFAKYVLGKPNISFTQAQVTNREALLQNGTVQFISDGYSVTPQRAEVVGFAGPYLVSGTVIGVLASNTTVKSPSDLNGKPVATLAGLTENSLLAVVPKAKARTFDSNGAIVQSLLQKRVDAIALDQPSLLGIVATHKGTIKALTPQPINKLYFGIGVPKNDPAYKTVVNTWLKEIETSGYYAKLWQATVGDVAPAPTPPEIGSVPGS